MVLHSSAPPPGDILKQLQQLLEAQSKRDKQELLDAVSGEMSGARTEMSNAMTELLVHFKQLEQRQEARGDVMMQLLMALMGQQLKPTACSLKSAEYRDPVIAAYNVARLVDGKKQLLCMVSDRYFPADDVTAGHIMRVDWAGLAGHLDVVIHSPRNIIFMHKRIEQAFDRQEWCLLVQPDESLKIEVLNPKLLQPRSGDIIRPRKSEADLMEELRDAAAARAKRLLMVGEPRDAASERGTEEALCWQDLHGKCLVMPPDAAADARPYKRCVALHAWAAVHTAEGNGWKAKDEVQVPLEGWQSPGADQQLLVRLLKDAQTLDTLVYDATQGSEAKGSGVTPEDSFTSNRSG